MRLTLIVVCVACLSLVISCNDSSSPVAPGNGAPVAPEAVEYSIIGYWQAVACEGQGIEVDPYVHGVSLRRDRTYVEYDSAGSLVVTPGEYRYADGELHMTPTDGPFQTTAVWVCRVSADTMTWCRCGAENPAAWTYVRSTRE